MRVLVTASRDWLKPHIIEGYLDTVYLWWVGQGGPGETFIVVHGDAHAKAWALKCHQQDPRVDHEPHPADWDKHRRPAGKNPAGHIRNKEMIDTGIDVCLGFPLDGPGTPGCLALALAAGAETYRYENGVMRRLGR